MDILKNNNYDNYENVNSSSYRNDSSLKEHKDKFVTEYCSIKGWDANNLTIEQTTEIINHPNYKNIGKIFG